MSPLLKNNKRSGSKPTLGQRAWHVYILRCSDNTLYCGIAKDVAARFQAHSSGAGAKYTRGRTPLTLVWNTETPLPHSNALRLEREIKKLSKKLKLELIRVGASSSNTTLKKILSQTT